MIDSLIAIVLAAALSSGLGLLIARTTTGIDIWTLPSMRRLPRSVDGLAAMSGIALVILAFAALPWPLHPASNQAWVGHPALLLALIEGAFLAPVFAGLLASSPLAARAAMREAQVNAAGRLALWVAAGSVLWGGVGWTGLDVLGRIVLFVVGGAACAAAAGLGPFAPDASLSPSGAEEGLDESERWLAQMARHMRAGLMLTFFVISVVPGPKVVQPIIALIIAIAIGAVLVAGLRQVQQTLPRLTLHATVRWCLWRMLPVAVVASAYLELVAGIRG